MVPAGGVDVESIEDPALQRFGAGDDVDGVPAGGEGDVADAVEFAKRPGAAEVLVGEVGVAHVGLVQGAADDAQFDGAKDSGKCR